MSKKLKPCPFCGKDELCIKTGTVTWPGKEDTSAYFVQCSKCMAQTSYFTSETAAINAWNRRALLDPYQKYAKELYHALEYMLNITGDVLEAISPLFHDLQSDLKDEPKQYQALIDKIESETSNHD